MATGYDRILLSMVQLAADFFTKPIVYLVNYDPIYMNKTNYRTISVLLKYLSKTFD